MSRRILFTFLSILVFLPLLFLITTNVRGQSYYSYSASGYVCDDLNANGGCEPNEPGLPGMLIYADNTLYGPRVYTNAYGYWQLNNLSGSHLIEIANAGSNGSRPTTSEKVSVSGPTSTIHFGVQNRGYDVTGYVKDQNGHPVSGATVYVDVPGRQMTTTDAAGFYTIRDVGYDTSTPIPGVQGGHGINVLGYEANSVLVNPQYATASLSTNITVGTQGGGHCLAVVTPARNPSTGACINFGTPCDVPAGWVLVSNCIQTGGQCTPNTQAGQPYQGCDGIRQYCTLTPTYADTNCQVSNVATNCHYVPGQCGYQSGGYGGGSSNDDDNDEFIQSQQFMAPQIQSYDNTPASWVDYSWQSQQPWYEPSTQYMEPNQSWNQEYWY